MKGESHNLVAPDRLSTSEEVRWATVADPERVLQRCLANSLRGKLQIPISELAELSADDLQVFFQFSAWEDGHVH